MAQTAAIIFNLQYRGTEYFKSKNKKILKIDTKTMFDYYDRPEAVDCTEVEPTKGAFDYYNYRVGSTGAFSTNGTVPRKQLDADVKKYKPKIIMRAILSFTDEFAIECDIKDPIKMKNLIRRSMNKNLSNMGFDPNNIIWSAFYHTNTKSPHLHITFYEKVPTRKRYMINKKDFIKMKRGLVQQMNLNISHYVTRDERKNELINSLYSIGLPDSIIDCLTKSHNNSKKDYRKIQKSPLYKKIVELEKILPTSGSMKYNSLNMQPYKEQVNEITRIILENKKIKPIFEKYIDQLNKELKIQEKLYGTGTLPYMTPLDGMKVGVGLNLELQNNFKQKKLDSLYTQIGNMILQNILMFRKDIQEFNDPSNHQSNKTINKRELNMYRRNNIKTRSNNAYHYAVQQIAGDLESSFFSYLNMKNELDHAMKVAKEQAYSKN